LAQKPVDLLLERIQLQPGRRSLMARRLLRSHLRRTVMRSIPYRRASSLIPTPRTKCSRRNSAPRSASSTPPSLTRSQARIRGRPASGRLYPAIKGGALSTGSRGEASTGADTTPRAP
jgi:hypothetical protein